MRPIEVPDEQIINAGKQLIAVGRRVTGFGLRQITKSGETKRLKNVWDDYLRTTQSGTATEPQTDLPAEMIEVVAQVSRALVDKINKIAIELNNTAMKASERRLTALVRDTNELRQQVEQELMDANDTVNHLETQLDEKDTAIEQLKKNLENANLVSQTQEVEIAQLKERLSATETYAKKEAEHSSMQLTILTNEKLSLIGQQESLSKELDNLKMELADKKAELKHLQIALQSMRDNNNALENEISVLRSDLVENNTLFTYQKIEIEDLNRQLAVKTNEWQEDERQVVVLRESLAKTTGQLESIKAQNESLVAVIKEMKVNESMISELENQTILDNSLDQ